MFTVCTNPPEQIPCLWKHYLACGLVWILPVDGINTQLSAVLVSSPILDQTPSCRLALAEVQTASKCVSVLKPKYNNIFSTMAFPG